MAPDDDSSPLDSEIVPDSMESKLAAPDSASRKLVPYSMAPKFVAPDSMSLELVLDSPKLVPDSLPDSQELVPDSVPDSPELVPDSLPPGAFVCARCLLVHEDRQASERAHSRRWPCSRCSLVHEEYALTTWIIYVMDTFDCKTSIPDVEKLEMDGNTIIVPEHVLKKMGEKKR
jgi:hypothetical protein